MALTEKKNAKQPLMKNFHTENCLRKAFADPRKQIKIRTAHIRMQILTINSKLPLCGRI